MKTIACPFCREEILVIPDVKAMDKAVTKHALRHIPNTKNYLYKRILNALFARVFMAFSEEPGSNREVYAK